MAAKCGYVKKGSADLLVCVEKRKHGYAGWVYGKGSTSKRLPVSLGKPKNLYEAFRNAKAFVRKVGRK